MNETLLNIKKSLKIGSYDIWKFYIWQPPNRNIDTFNLNHIFRQIFMKCIVKVVDEIYSLINYVF